MFLSNGHQEDIWQILKEFLKNYIKLKINMNLLVFTNFFIANENLQEKYHIQLD